ncbi:MAG: transporter [Bacteroidetes bacterium]|nr:transporter [Bacteroidota bacterium]
MGKNIFISFVGFCSVSLHAQQTKSLDALITDRPDQTEAPFVVPKNYLQVETGFMFEESSTGNTKTESLTYNTTLYRYGLLYNLELRLGLDWQQNKTFNQNISTEVSNGLAPVLLGFKTEIAQESGWLPQIGLLGALFIPGPASSTLETEDTGGEIRFSLAHTLSQRISIGYNLGVLWDGNNLGSAYFYTLAAGISLDKNWSVFAEIYGDFPENLESNHLWDAGITYLVSKSFQLDLSAGSSFSAEQDYFISTGISFRLPN